MKISQKGTTRITILIGPYAIKIPTYIEHRLFLKGCVANYDERSYSKHFKNFPKYYNKIAPTIYCSWFGLLSIQLRTQELNRHLTKREIKRFRTLTSDLKKENFGYLNGRLVCFDYH